MSLLEYAPEYTPMLPLILFFIGVIFVNIIWDNLTYKYLDSQTRVHRKTGQKQMYINVIVGPGERSKGWINLKEEEEVRN